VVATPVFVTRLYSIRISRSKKKGIPGYSKTGLPRSVPCFRAETLTAMVLVQTPSFFFLVVFSHDIIKKTQRRTFSGATFSWRDSDRPKISGPSDIFILSPTEKKLHIFYLSSNTPFMAPIMGRVLPAYPFGRPAHPSENSSNNITGHPRRQDLYSCGVPVAFCGLVRINVLAVTFRRVEAIFWAGVKPFMPKPTCLLWWL